MESAQSDPNFEHDKQLLRSFLTERHEMINGVAHYNYIDLLQKISNRQESNLHIPLDDLSNHIPENDRPLMDRIVQNTYSYIRLLHQVVDELLPEPNELPHNFYHDIPSQARKNYSIYVLPFAKALDNLSSNKEANSLISTLRSVRSSHIGSLITFKGIVVRMSDIRPLLSVATYRCQQCKEMTTQTINGQSFIPEDKCASESCRRAVSRGKLELLPALSNFIKIQEIRVQENSSEVPVGSVPRTVTVLARGEGVVRKCVAGDEIVVTGIFLPVPQSHEARRSNFSRQRLGLSADTYFEAQQIIPQKSYLSNVNTERVSTFLDSINVVDEDFYNMLADHIAPEIYGHLDVKKALLLQLVGGVGRILDDGVRLRGDLNILLVGDPGVAKSQLLKRVTTISHRSIYTTGRGSSGVGLTANVQIDPLTKEATLDGGALVLADMGVCCIDEFDKMDDIDRTSLYETMEQQTVSIAKGGITTTLNARTAVLAAANPINSRYDTSLTPAQNINLAAALLTRFDLVFVLLDKADPELDRQLANHVAKVHRGEVESFGNIPLEVLRGYIKHAKTFEPTVPSSLTSDIVARYVSLRSDEDEAVTLGGVGYVSPRSLMTILRLAQAIARIKLKRVVDISDVNEALRLMQSADRSLRSDGGGRRQTDVNSAIFDLIRIAAEENDFVAFSNVVSLGIARGYTEEQVSSTISLYETYHALRLDDDGVIHLN
ncbi:hypothetical protein GEMRC1_006911 [Eukaryota sp. GEM-RC1]